MTITERIQMDLQRYAQLGEDPPYPLTLQGIADKFGSSTQPARLAVEALLQDRWLLRNHAGRLQLNGRRKRQGKPDLPPTPETREPDVDTQLSKRIVQLSLQGRDVFLREEETAERLGVGRTVLRASLQRLNGNGMLEYVKRRGWRVIAYSEKRMLDYVDVRTVLELRAMELARPRYERAKLETFLARNSPDPKTGAPRLNNELHAYWIRQAENVYITEFFAREGQYYAALFDYATLGSDVIAEMASQHRAILEALLESDWSRAKRALRQHIEAQRPNVIGLLHQAEEEAEA